MANDALTNEEKNAIVKFKLRAQEFWAQWNDLNTQKIRGYVATQDARLKQKYQKLMSDGLEIKKGIEKITSVIDRAASAYKSVKNWMAERFGKNDSTLNSLELAPIVAIGGGAAILFFTYKIGLWLSDAFFFRSQIKEQKKLVEQGVEPARAYELVTDAAEAAKSDNNAGFFESLAGPIAIAAAAVLLLPKIFG
jgi:hypothetical protein